MTTRVQEYSIFEKRLTGVLELEVEGEKACAFSNHLMSVQVHYHSYGYEAEVRFNNYLGQMNELFAKEKVMKAFLKLEPVDPEGKKKVQPVRLQGIVTNRYYQPMGQLSLKGVEHFYVVTFKDPAQASWGQHFPIKVFVEKTMKDVIDAEKNPLITINYDWEVLTEVKPILAFSLEFKRGLSPDRQTNFYSFLTWYLYQNNGILDYDYEKNSYAIRGKKSEEGSVMTLPDWIITPPKCQLPGPLYASDRMITFDTESRVVENENPAGFQGVHKDAFKDTAYTYFPEQISQKVKSKLVREKVYIRFFLKELAEFLELDKLFPGNLIEFKRNEQLAEGWVDDPSLKGKVYRIVNILLCMHVDGEIGEVERLDQMYRFEIQIEAEPKEELYVDRPLFVVPSYPFFVQGEVFSDVGDKEQATFNVVKQEKVPLGQYQIKVPLVEDKKHVVVPFSPHILSGQHYFPLCKDQRVMLAMHFGTAFIERVLDWQPLTRLPLETQANRVVFGSNGIDKYVIEQHEFKDGQDSVFTIKQSSSPDQTQTIQIQEKELTIIVEEKGKSTISVRLHREDGLLLQLKDEEGGITQQSLYSSESITHLSKGGAGESTVVQTPESISLTAKKVQIDCEEMIVEAKKNVSQKAANNIFLDAPLVHAKDLLKAGA